MNVVVDVAAVALVFTGAFFFFAGTVGLLRFPDVYCRLHALTKADNLGLGLIALGLILLTPEWAARLQILLVWLLVLASSATVCHLLARSSLERGVPGVGQGAGAAAVPTRPGDAEAPEPLTEAEP